jgi:NADH:ubiquinone oxidoreductase subunit 2 (subunit N)
MIAWWPEGASVLWLLGSLPWALQPEAPRARALALGAARVACVAALIGALVGTGEIIAVFEERWRVDAFSQFAKAVLFAALGLTYLAAGGAVLRELGALRAALVPMAALAASGLVSSVDLLLMMAFGGLALVLGTAGVGSAGGGGSDHRPKLGTAWRWTGIAVVAGALGVAGIRSQVASTLFVLLPAMSRTAPSWIWACWLLAAAPFLLMVAAAPFHGWVPSWFERGAGARAQLLVALWLPAGAVALLRVGQAGSGWPLGRSLATALALLALLTVLGSALASLAASRPGHLLGWFVVHNVGFLLVGLVSFDAAGVAATLTALTAVVLGGVAAWSALVAVGAKGCGEEDTEADWTRLAAQPAAAWGFALGLVCLAGLPPTQGFVGRWETLDVAMGGGFAWLVVAAVLAWSLQILLALRLLVRLVADRPASAPAARMARAPAGVLFVTAVTLLVLGLFPAPLSELVSVAARTLTHLPY